MHLLILFTLILFSAPAYAQNNAIAKLCEHVTYGGPQNNAAYIPGVDVHGNPVVPADLGGGNILYNPIILPINIDIAKRNGLNLPVSAEINSNIANMILLSDGHIAFGDEDVTPSVKSLCENTDAQMKKNQSNQAEPHRHESANPVLSSDKIEGEYPED